MLGSDALLLALIAMLVAAILVMAVAILIGRGIRDVQSRRRRPHVERAQRALIRLVADEDASIAGLGPGPGLEVRMLEVVASEMLQKMRGVSSKRIVEVLEQIGTIGRARKRVDCRGALGRGRAATVLGLTGDEDDLSLLIPLLADRSQEVRLAASRAVATLGHPGAAASLLASADGDRRLPVAPVAAALLALGEPTVEALRSALREGNPRASLIAANVLGHLNGVSAVPELCVTLAEHSEADVRRAAAVALGSLASADAVAALACALTSDGATGVRAAAAAALGEIGSAGANSALRRGLADPAFDVARSSAISLSRCGVRGRAILVEVEAAGGNQAPYAIEALWLRRLADSKRRPNSRTARAA